MSTRKQIMGRWAALKTERSGWFEQWRELAEHINPWRARFELTSTNKGNKVSSTIINSSPTRAQRILAAGMMAGITSPARPWFRLTMPGPVPSDSGPQRGWLHAVEEVIRLYLAKSNTYNALFGVYLDIGQFAVTAMHMEEDAEDGIRAYAFPVGSYALATSARGRVDTLYRELSMTTAQMVEQFGLEACSITVRNEHEQGRLDVRHDVLHIIEPNADHAPGAIGPKGKAWCSCWLELTGNDEQGFLREAGYREFPVMAPRWDVTGGDAYGSGPGMVALGDCKALQLHERRGAQAMEKVVNPPMAAPTSLMNAGVSLLPGAINYVDVAHAGQSFRPAMDINPNAITIFDTKIARLEQHINSAFYADLWLMMSEADGSNVTAREVVERHEEKMMQLGPVLERLQDELLDPMIDRIFSILLEAGLIPEPPEEMLGMELRVEYISILAQAQKLLGTSAVERLASFTGSLAAVRPDALDKLNVDAILDEYAGMLGTKPDLILDAEAVAALRQQRSDAAKAQQQGQAAMQMAEGAKTLSQADMTGDTALSRMMGALGNNASANTGK